MPKQLFFRSFLIIVLLISAVGVSLDKVLQQMQRRQDQNSELQHLKGSFLYIETLVDSPKLFQRHQSELEKQLGFPVMLLQLDDFSGDPSFIQALTDGAIQTTADADQQFIYYRQYRQSAYVLAIGPFSAQSPPYSDRFIITCYYILIATVLFFWLRPLSQDLNKLRSAALKLVEENFATRVEITNSSSIALVGEAFNDMAQRIQRLASSHRDLSHAVSHELRTPLARFKFSLEIVANAQSAQQREKYLQAMKQDVREMEDLIEEMLKYAQFSAENLQLHYSTVRILPWMRELIRQYDQENLSIRITLDAAQLQETDAITIDSHLFNRAVNNLIRNALRYAGASIQITLSPKPNALLIMIDDDGIGIPEQQWPHIFQPFVRVDDSRNKQSGGYGLGLAITEKIIRQHGGRIHVEKAPKSGGARFVIELPEPLLRDAHPTSTDT